MPALHTLTSSVFSRSAFVFYVLLGALVPLQSFAQLIPCKGPDCQLCHLIQLMNNFINLLIALGVLWAVVMISFAGFKLVTSAGSSEAKQQAKSSILNVLIGFVIMLLAYLMVDTFMGALTGKGLSVRGIQCMPPPPTATPASPATNPNAPQSPQTGGETGSGAVPGVGTYTDDTARSTFSDAGIGVNKTCNGGQTGTCLGGMRTETVNTIVSLNQSCSGCVKTVTGGTETGAGHTCNAGAQSHCSGYKVDLRPNPQLDSYITNNYRSCGTRGGYCDSNGAMYVNEGDHWDVLVP
jgi:hypothetical protein